VPTITGTDGPDTLIGTAEDDSIFGLNGVDTLQGGGGNDILDGGLGADVMAGGTGDDVYYVDSNRVDQVIEQAGEGYDRVYVATSAAYWTPDAGVEIEFIEAESRANGNEFGQTMHASRNANYRQDLDGGGGDDILDGFGGNDLLTGGTGADRFVISTTLTNYYYDTITDFEVGTDLIVLGTGVIAPFSGLAPGALSADAFTIGPAATTEAHRIILRNDGYLYYDPDGSLSAPAILFASLGSAVLTAASFVVVEMSSTPTLSGTEGDDVLTGFWINDTIDGGGGDDQIYAGSDRDLLYGGTGNDSFFVDTLDLVIEAVGEGNDRVFANSNFVLRAGQEIETLSTDRNLGLGAIDLTGNEFGQNIYGNNGANLISGQGGDDYLLGLGGNDRIFGGTGNDIMGGGAGDDLFYVDSIQDRAYEASGEGNDRVFASTSYALIAGQEIETLSTDWNAGTAAIDLTGNEFGQNIYGNNGANRLYGQQGGDLLLGLGGNDTLDGGTGADMMDGGAGDDLFYVDDVGDRVYEAAGDGSDRVFAGVSHALIAGQEIETLSTDWNAGTAAINLTGNAFGQSIYGNNGVNTIDGGAGNDILLGLDGNDILYGGAGADTMYGGAGDDLIYADATGDRVYEAVGQGNDRVFAGASHALIAGQEIETLSTDWNAGTTAIDLTGNEFGQIIYGNNGANTIDGGGGNDYLLGLGGSDIFAFTTALGSGNIDRIADFGGGVDRIHLDDAVFTGLGRGTLAASAFVTGTAAGDADDRIVYDATTGALYYDADGTGAAAAIYFASLGPDAGLSATDIVVI
jgi:serralysin